MPLSDTPSVNPVLSATAEKFFQDSSIFVARRIAPVFNSGLQSGQYYVFDAANMASQPDIRTRAPGTAYDRMVMSLSEDTFFCQDRGIEVPVDDTERAKYASAFDADVAAMRKNAHAIMMAEDKRIKALVDAVTTSSTPSVKWDAATGVPRTNVKTARNTIYNKTGVEPNTVVMSREVRDAILDNADFLERIKYTSNPNELGVSDIARYLQIPNVVVTGALENSAKEGQTLSLGAIWNDDVFLCYVDPSQDLAAPNWARTFSWTQGGGQQTVESYREEKIKSDIHRIYQYTGEKVVGADLAYRFDDVLT